MFKLIILILCIIFVITYVFSILAYVGLIKIENHESLDNKLLIPFYLLFDKKKKEDKNDNNSDKE